MNPRIPVARIQACTPIEITRTLPIPGEITVKLGQSVQPADIVGQVQRPGEFVVVDIAAALNKPVAEAALLLQYHKNDPVEAGDILAQTSARWSRWHRVCRSPVKGIISAVVEARVLIEITRCIDRLTAGIAGTISAIDHTRSVTISTVGTSVTASYALGGEGYGRLKTLSDNPRSNIDGEAFALLDRDAVFIAGGSVDAESLRRAEAVGVAGLIAGSIDASLLTLNPPLTMPVIVTEGLGQKIMPAQLFTLLTRRLNNHVCLLNGFATGEPPRIIIPGKPDDLPVGADIAAVPDGCISLNSLVRVTSGQMAGAWGKICAIPEKPISTADGLIDDAVQVQFPNEKIFISCHNLEQLA